MNMGMHWIAVGNEDRTAWALKAVEPGFRVLDVGGYDGASARAFAQRASLTVVLEPRTEVLPAGQSFRCVAGKGESLPFRTATFDLVACLEVIEHVGAQEQERLLAEIRRVLRSTGTLVLTTPHRGLFSFMDLQAIQGLVRRLTGRPGERFHRHYSARELEDLLRRHGLRLERLERRGLVLMPLATWLGILDRGRLTSLRRRMIRRDAAKGYGWAGYSLRITARPEG